LAPLFLSLWLLGGPLAARAWELDKLQNPNAPLGTVATADEPPRNVRLIEKKFEELSSPPTSAYSRIALAIKPDKWRHAETDNFIFHYRRITEAQKVVNQIEYHLWFVAKALGASKDRYQRKSHVFIFKDEAEWKEFLPKTDASSWAASFAHADELYLNVREKGGFEENILAHETTHAVVARLYFSQPWPVWLNEGFAEYMGGASQGARKGISAFHYQGALRMGDIPLAQLTSMTDYPTNREQVHALYQSSQKLVRFLMNELPKDRFPKFVDQILATNDFKKSLLAVYSDKIPSMQMFERRYERFVK
jgi:hypothetical protein